MQLKLPLTPHTLEDVGINVAGRPVPLDILKRRAGLNNLESPVRHRGGNPLNHLVEVLRTLDRSRPGQTDAFETLLNYAAPRP
jgi:hypothetical protein